MVSNKGTGVGGQERLTEEAAHSGHAIFARPAGIAAEMTSGAGETGHHVLDQSNK